MRKLWTKLVVYGICSLVTFGGLTFLPQSPLQIESEAHSGRTDSSGVQQVQTGTMAGTAGWQQDLNGWKYRNGEGFFVKGCFTSVEGNWYYFDQDGYMVRGWQQVIDDWYYFDANGHMVTGAAVIGETYYYFEASGKLNEDFYEAD